MENFIHLVKFVAQYSSLSRRSAEEAIREGLVAVGGKTVKKPGLKISPTDHVKLNGKLLNKPQTLTYVLLNKPEKVITTAADSQGRCTVLDLLPKNLQKIVFPVGRLDFMTKGLILLTNDGDLAYRLSHPKFEISKTYAVTLDRNITLEELAILTRGFMMHDGFIKADKAVFASKNSTRKILVEIHSGRNRIIRRMFSHIGFNVESLVRVGFGPLMLKDLTEGSLRMLTKEEVESLKQVTGLVKKPI